jgi:hypothetical protein
VHDIRLVEIMAGTGEKAKPTASTPAKPFFCNQNPRGYFQ